MGVRSDWIGLTYLMLVWQLPPLLLQQLGHLLPLWPLLFVVVPPLAVAARKIVRFRLGSGSGLG